MTDHVDRNGQESELNQKPRRSSPRLPIRRLVIIACPHWKKYREVYSKNIGRRSLLVIVPENPPPPKSPIAVWMGSDSLEKPRAWTKGHVVRLESNAGSDQETGVVIHLTDPAAEAIWCLIPRGDEDKLPLPRSTPRFRRRHEERSTLNEKPETAVSSMVRPAIELDRRPSELPSPTPSMELPTPQIPGSPLPETPTSPPRSPLPEDGLELPETDELLKRPDTKVEPPRPNVVSPRSSDDEVPPLTVPSQDQLLTEPDTHVETPPFQGTYRHSTSRGSAVIEETVIPLDDVPTVKQTPPAPMPGEPNPRTQPPTRQSQPPARNTQPPTRQTQNPPRQTQPPARNTQPPPRQSQPPPRQTQPPARNTQPPPRQTQPPLSQTQNPSRQPQPPQPPQQDFGGLHQIKAKPSRDKPPLRGRVKGKAPVVGIDFGTTYAKVAIYDNGEVILVEDTSSTSSTRASVPSVVAFQPDGSHVIGERAQEFLAVDPATVISSVKRAMGLTFSDPLANGLLGSLACPSRAGPNDTILFDVHGEQLTVPDVASRILAHMRTMASEYIGADVREAVLTMPVDFDRRAKRELELAAKMAGLEVKALIPEPVSAAMGCGYDGSGRAFVAVYDFGGGTFDSSIVEVGRDRFMVRGSAGDRWLGGDDFDELMARYVADEFQKKTSISIHNRAEEWQRLLFACEEAKRWLSTLNSVDVVLPRAALTADGPKTLLVPVTRTIFDELTQELISSTVEICKQSSRQAGIPPKNVDTLLITGGSTRIPAIRDAARALYQKDAAFGVHPQHAVVIGAAVRAAVLSGAPVPEDFAQRLRGQGAVGRTIGLALSGGTTEHIIDSSQRAPVAAHRQYSTNRDNQTTIRIEIVQGSSHRTEENAPVGGFIVEGLPQNKAGVINLDVYFELSTTGKLHVTAQERSSGQRAQGTFDMD